MSFKSLGVALGVAAALWAPSAVGESNFSISEQISRSGFLLENGLKIPAFNPVEGRMLFATKGCVVCHSVNEIGGEDATEFSADYMDGEMNAFEFAARMWRGASAMIQMQEGELGGQIELTGEELASIIAFVHDEDEQEKFRVEDIPHNMRHFMQPNFAETTDHEIMESELVTDH